MNPAVREPDDGADAAGYRVGAFRAGTPITQWMLGRYLLGRVIAVAVTRMLLGAALLLAAVAVGIYFAGSTLFAVLVGLVSVVVMAARAILGAILRHTTMPRVADSAGRQLRRLERETRADVGLELRRLGLPSHPWTMPLLAWWLIGRRRNATTARLRGFEVRRVVPPARLDQLHLLLADGASRGGMVD